MAWKDSVFYGMVNMKCPRCHEGDMFPSGTLYNVRKFATMNKRCEHCNQSFDPEPGYYFGAMLVSYAMSTAIFVAVWVILALIYDDVTLTMMVIAILAIVLGLLPINFRLSRSIWINAMVKYRGPAQQHK